MTSEYGMSHEPIRVAKGQDWTVTVRVLAPEKVKLAENAAAGATSLSVAPLDDALSNGDKLLFGKNTVVTLTANASAGTTSLTVSAIPGPLRLNDVGQKIRDITGYDLEFEVSTRAGDATPIIEDSEVTVSILTQTGDLRGLVQITGDPDTTSSETAGRYFDTLWKRDSGTMRPLVYGDFEIAERGFL